MWEATFQTETKLRSEIPNKKISSKTQFTKMEMKQVMGMKIKQVRGDVNKNNSEGSEAESRDRALE